MANLVYLSHSAGPDIVFNNNIEFVERYQSVKALQTTRRTLGGGLVVFYGTAIAGRAITLRAGSDRGWVKYSDYQSLLALALEPGFGHPDHGSTMTLTYGAETFNVMFRHEDSPAVDLTPLVDTVNLGADSYMTGSIKLLTI